MESAVAPPAPPRQLFVMLSRGSEGMRMRLAPADPSIERFAVVNAGLGIAAVEFFDDATRDSLVEAYHAFRRLDLGDASAVDRDRLFDACGTWRRVLAASSIDMQLEREALYGPPLPRAARPADGGGIAFRPWDIELMALEDGLRHLVKLDRVPPAAAELREIAAQRGLCVEAVTPEDGGEDRSITLLLARDAAVLAEAIHLERRLLVRGGDPIAGGAAQRMGELLGYPSCCVERFTHVAEHNDTTLAWALLPVPDTPAPPLTQWLQPGLALLSHSPCSLDCSASMALGQRLLDAIEARQPGFTPRWRDLTGRIQAVDPRGNRLALAIEGELAAGPKVLEASLLSADRGDSPARGLYGASLELEAGGVVCRERGWYAPYAADHRGAA